MKKRYLLPIGFLAVIFLGPTQKYSDFNGNIEYFQSELITLNESINHKDNDVQNLKPNNESRLIWADSIRKTPYAVV